MEQFGLIGQRLGHSYSPQIHALLGDYPYTLHELAPEELEQFLATTPLQGLNVTIPYKKAVLPLCRSVSDRVRRIGSANTLVRTPDGWTAENTDYDGFAYMVRHSGAAVEGKKAVIFGNGGVSLTVRTVLADLGAGEIVVISRNGPDNYDNLDRHRDAQIVVNATPVGMYPENGKAVADLGLFFRLEQVYDMIYNPMRTALLLQAERLGVPAENGLGMLVAQAKRASELFMQREIADGETERITGVLESRMRNIILVGMPGCGKSTVGRLLAKSLDRPFVDADEEIVRVAGMGIPEIFEKYGQSGFRQMETQTLEALGKRSGCVIATGGGCVTRPENYPLLHQNGIIVWLQRALCALPRDGRPLSQTTPVETLFAQRKALYEDFTDIQLENNGELSRVVERLKEELS